MSDREIEFLKLNLEPSRTYLEFGAGGSTELAAQNHHRRIVSVETDAAWIEKLKLEPIIQLAIEQGRLKFEHIDIGPVRPWGFPEGESLFRNWPMYHTVPFVKYDWHYDLILIDGRFRVSCALAAHSFMEDEAIMLFHDYPNRMWYSEIEKFFDIVNSAETFFSFRKRKNINYRSLYASIMNSMFDVR
jgi:hypothetical protein